MCCEKAIYTNEISDQELQKDPIGYVINMLDHARYNLLIDTNAARNQILASINILKKHFPILAINEAINENIEFTNEQYRFIDQRRMADNG